MASMATMASRRRSGGPGSAVTPTIPGDSEFARGAEEGRGRSTCVRCPPKDGSEKRDLIIKSLENQF